MKRYWLVGLAVAALAACEGDREDEQVEDLTGSPVAPEAGLEPGAGVAAEPGLPPGVGRSYRDAGELSPGQLPAGDAGATAPTPAERLAEGAAPGFGPPGMQVGEGESLPPVVREHGLPEATALPGAQPEGGEAPPEDYRQDVWIAEGPPAEMGTPWWETGPMATGPVGTGQQPGAGPIPPAFWQDVGEGAEVRTAAPGPGPTGVGPPSGQAQGPAYRVFPEPGFRAEEPGLEPGPEAGARTGRADVTAPGGAAAGQAGAFATGDRPPAAPPAATGTVTGRVERVDEDLGAVEIATDEGTLRLLVPSTVRFHRQGLEAPGALALDEGAQVRATYRLSTDGAKVVDSLEVLEPVAE